MSRLGVIGSGFSGLASACYMAAAGHDVHVFEKNAGIGGRARHFNAEGFMFDMGPSWYWMPEVFEHFFNDFGKSASDYYDLVKLDPGFQIIFDKTDVLKIPSSLDELYANFEAIEKGSATALKKYLKEAEYKYSIGMGDLIYKPAYSWFEYMSPSLLSGMMKTNVFQTVSTYVRSHFKDPRLIALMEFPVLFLGAMPDKIPALYSLMNHAALTQGTFYPMGGMYKIIEGMEKLALSLDVKIHPLKTIEKIAVHDRKVKSLLSSPATFEMDGLIAAADYHHVEQELLPEGFANYKSQYWDKKVFAPSSLIFYLGINKRIPKLEHHNLFFDSDFKTHADAIYRSSEWPENPLFYACCPSKTDSTVAPEGMENLFLLIPVAAGLEENKVLIDEYFNKLMTRMEAFCGENIRDHIVFKRSYCVSDFIKDYNSYKGNAYGLANTLGQTAVLKPSIRNKKIKNMFYAGQLTVPGPGVPPALISGKIAATELMNYLKKEKYESVI